MKYISNYAKIVMPVAVFVVQSCAVQTVEKIEKQQPIAAFIAEKEKQRVKKDEPIVSAVPKTSVVELKSTLQYLPKQSYDEFGGKIIYQSTPNPYLQKASVVSKEEVDIFIQARRAFKTERFSHAKKLLLKLVDMNANLSGPKVMLGKISEDESNIDDALKYYQEAILVNPNNVNAYIGLAKIQRIKGRYIHAQNTYADLLQSWKDFPEAHANLAVLYDLYLNKTIEAQQHMEAYLFLTNKKNTEVSKWLVEIQQRTKILDSFIDNPPDAVLSTPPIVNGENM